MAEPINDRALRFPLCHGDAVPPVPACVPVRKIVEVGTCTLGPIESAVAICTEGPLQSSVVNPFAHSALEHSPVTR